MGKKYLQNLLNLFKLDTQERTFHSHGCPLNMAPPEHGVFPLHCAGLNTNLERETAAQYTDKTWDYNAHPQVHSTASL